MSRNLDSDVQPQVSPPKLGELVYRRPCEHGKCGPHYDGWHVCPGGVEIVLDPERVLTTKDHSSIRQFAFDIVMGELGMDDGDADDQDYATEAVDAWMEHWQRIRHGVRVRDILDVLDEETE